VHKILLVDDQKMIMGCQEGRNSVKVKGGGLF
jgi:hypothetical protein